MHFSNRFLVRRHVCVCLWVCTDGCVCVCERACTSVFVFSFTAALLRKAGCFLPSKGCHNTRCWARLAHIMYPTPSEYTLNTTVNSADSLSFIRRKIFAAFSKCTTYSQCLDRWGASVRLCAVYRLLMIKIKLQVWYDIHFVLTASERSRCTIL